MDVNGTRFHLLLGRRTGPLPRRRRTGRWANRGAPANALTSVTTTTGSELTLTPLPFRFRPGRRIVHIGAGRSPGGRPGPLRQLVLDRRGTHRCPGELSRAPEPPHACGPSRTARRLAGTGQPGTSGGGPAGGPAAAAAGRRRRRDRRPLPRGRRSDPATWAAGLRPAAGGPPEQLDWPAACRSRRSTWPPGPAAACYVLDRPARLLLGARPTPPSGGARPQPGRSRHARSSRSTGAPAERRPGSCFRPPSSADAVAAGRRRSNPSRSRPCPTAPCSCCSARPTRGPSGARLPRRRPVGTPVAVADAGGRPGGDRPRPGVRRRRRPAAGQPVRRRRAGRPGLRVHDADHGRRPDAARGRALLPDAAVRGQGAGRRGGQATTTSATAGAAGRAAPAPRSAATGEVLTDVLDGRGRLRLAPRCCSTPASRRRRRSRSPARSPTTGETLQRSPPGGRSPRRYPRGDGSELPFVAPSPAAPTGTWSCCSRRARGRYLRLRLRLVGNGRTTPADLRALRAYYPRFSYLERYLPAVYREDAGSASFLDRFLANLEGIATTDRGPDRRRADAVRPDGRARRGAGWLACWFDLALDPAWNERGAGCCSPTRCGSCQWRGTRARAADGACAWRSTTRRTTTCSPRTRRAMRAAHPHRGALPDQGNARRACSATRPRASRVGGPQFGRRGVATRRRAPALDRRCWSRCGAGPAGRPGRPPLPDRAAGGRRRRAALDVDFAAPALGFVPDRRDAVRARGRTSWSGGTTASTTLRTAYQLGPAVHGFDDVPLPATVPGYEPALTDWLQFQARGAAGQPHGAPLPRPAARPARTRTGEHAGTALDPRRAVAPGPPDRRAGEAGAHHVRREVLLGRVPGR